MKLMENYKDSWNSITENLGETYVYSFSLNKNEDLGQADLWAAQVQDFSLFSFSGLTTQSLDFRYTLLKRLNL